MYSLKHLILLIISIASCGFALLWLFNTTILNPFPNAEFYLLLAIYLIIIIVTAVAFSTRNLSIIHHSMGFQKTGLNALFWAIGLALILWSLDYYYQTLVLNTSMKSVASSWYIKHKTPSLIATFITMVIFAPVIEEILLRGIILKTLTHYMSKSLAAISVSSLFTLLHPNVVDWPSLFVASLVYVWLTFRFNSIVPAIVAHIVNNFITFVFFLQIID